MDLAKKRRYLEEVRAAREAKQHSLQQQLKRHSGQGFPFTACASGNNMRLSYGSSATDIQLRENSSSGSGGGVSAEVGRRESSVWSLQVGIGAITLESRVDAKKNDDNDGGSGTAAGDLSVMSVGGTSTCVKDRLQDFEADDGRRVMSMSDTAMLRVHVLRTESCFDCSDRCVLDVIVLPSNVVDDDVRDSNDSDSLLVAAALSTSLPTEKSDDAPPSVLRRGSEAWMMSPSLLLPLTSVVGATAATESMGTARGLVLVWLVSLGKTNNVAPSVVVPLCFDSEIRVLTYTRYRPQFLFGGAANGSVVMWRIDHALRGRHHAVTTTHSRSSPLLSPSFLLSDASAVGVAPNEQSFPSPHSHHSRVLAMAIHGDANYHHLYSISQDGRVCMWALPKLRLPASTRDGVISGQSLGCMGSCAAFVDRAADAMSKVVVGCFDGRVLEGYTKSSQLVEFTAAKFFSASATSMLPGQEHHPSRDASPHNSGALNVVGEGSTHRAAVAIVAPHPLHADPRISDIVLTAAADGSCSLWLGLRRVSIDGFAAQVNCLQWSPKHSAVFVAGENNGRVAAWDLSRSSCSPVAFVYLHSASASTSAGWARGSRTASLVDAPSRHNAAVTSLSFSDDGTRLACGTASGEVHLLRLRPDLVLETTATTATDRRRLDHHADKTEDSFDAAASSWLDAWFAF